MDEKRKAIVVGGTSGLGKDLAKTLVVRGEDVVITGRESSKLHEVAAEIGAKGIPLDLTRPESIAAGLASIDRVDHLVISAIHRDDNTVRNYDIGRATQLAILKLVGYTEVVHTLAPRLSPNASIVLFGGLAKERPYPGSTTVTAVNGAVSSMIRTLASELAPIRVNAIHPGIIGDSPAWEGKPPEVLERVRVRTPTGRLATMADCTGAVLFLLDNNSVNGINLIIDGGTLLI
jgi:NAD(P)-dependent dehydrogenase (short-subunit alcohol dehydrogenase family)